jgi:3,4-dihydroxy 2-butanone 4-phosphate synthase/GTP cyclohydrolase II
MDTPNGSWRVRVFKSSIDSYEHLVLQKGEIKEGVPTLLRVQWDNAFKEVTSFLTKGEMDLHRVFSKIQKAGCGIVLMLRGSKPKERIFQDLEHLSSASSSMDPRQLGVGAQILRKLGVTQIRLLSDSSEKKVGLKGFDLDVVEVVPLKD